jgi:hypothetical protein
MREKLEKEHHSPDSISLKSPNPYTSIDFSAKEGKSQIKINPVNRNTILGLNRLQPR